MYVATTPAEVEHFIDSMKKYQDGSLLDILSLVEFKRIEVLGKQSFVLAMNDKFYKDESCVAYVRVSGEGQARSGFGLYNQTAAIVQHCKENNLNLCAIAFDVGITADNEQAILKLMRKGVPEKECFKTIRPAMHYALDHLDCHNKLVVYALDRLWRENDCTGSKIRNIVKTWLSDIASICQPEYTLNDDSLTQKLVNAIKEYIAEDEKRKLTQRMADTRRAKTSLGKCCPGKAPFGYRKNNSKMLEIYEPEAVILRKMFSLFDQDHPNPTEVARCLNELGMFDRGGKIWRADRIHRLVRSRIYQGFVTYGNAEAFHPDLIIA